MQINKILNANYQYLPTIDVSASYNEQDSDDITSLDSNQTAVLLNLNGIFLLAFQGMQIEKLPFQILALHINKKSNKN